MKSSVARIVSIVVLGLGLAFGIPDVAVAGDLVETIPAEPGGSFYVQLDRGSVEIATHDQDTVEVRATTRSWGWSSGCDYEFELRSEAGDVHLRGRQTGFMSWLCGSRRVRVHALVPRDFSVSVQTSGGAIAIDGVDGRVDARTSGGGIELRSVGGSASVRTSGGSIRVADLGGDLEARTSGGRIEVTHVDGDIEARTSGGRVEIKGARGRANAKTSGGRISASFDGPPSGVLETSGGGIVVWFPLESGVDLDAKTSGGHVRVEHPILVEGSMSSRRVVGAMNGGGELLRLRTSGGSIEVRAN